MGNGFFNETSPFVALFPRSTPRHSFNSLPSTHPPQPRLGTPTSHPASSPFFQQSIPPSLGPLPPSPSSQSPWKTHTQQRGVGSKTPFLCISYLLTECRDCIRYTGLLCYLRIYIVIIFLHIAFALCYIS